MVTWLDIVKGNQKQSADRSREGGNETACSEFAAFIGQGEGLAEKGLAGEKEPDQTLVKDRVFVTMSKGENKFSIFINTLVLGIVVVTHCL